MSANALTFFSVDRFTGNVNGISDWSCRVPLSVYIAKVRRYLSPIFLFSLLSSLSRLNLWHFSTFLLIVPRAIWSIDRAKFRDLYRESKDTGFFSFPSLHPNWSRLEQVVWEEKRLEEERGLFNIDLESNESWSPTVILLISTTTNDNPCFIGYRLGFRLRNGKKKKKKRKRRRIKGEDPDVGRCFYKDPRLFLSPLFPVLHHWSGTKNIVERYDIRSRMAAGIEKRWIYRYAQTRPKPELSA